MIFITKLANSRSLAILLLAMVALVPACRRSGEARKQDNLEADHVNAPTTLPAGWKKIELLEDHCAIAMPASAKDATYDRDGYRYHATFCQEEGITYILNVGDAVPQTDEDFDNYVTGVEDGFMKEMKASGIALEKKRDRDVELGGKTSRQTILQSDTHRYTLRVVRGKDRAYVTICGGGVAGLDSRVDAFLNSLELK